jgi:arylformamidase
MSDQEFEGFGDLEKLIEDEVKAELEATQKIKKKNKPKPIKIDPQLDAAYNVRGSVKNVDDILQDFTLSSANFTNNCPYKVEYNLPYGNGGRNVLDLFWPNNSADAPIMMFIHGGYWRDLSKNDFSHMAKGLVENGCCVAIPSYSLCPEATLMEIINELRQACLYLWRRHSKPITVIGHSAGAHLAACLLATDWDEIEPYAPEGLVTKGLLISGLYDLSPLLKTSVNESLNLDKEMCQKVSPVQYVVDTTRQVDVIVGRKDPKAFIEQSRKVYDVWHLLGCDVSFEILDDKNHYSIISPLADKDSTLIKQILELQGRQPHKTRKVSPISVEEKVRNKLASRHADKEGDGQENETPDEAPKAAPTNDIYDELTRIKGVNEELAQKLYGVGIKSFEQLSLLNEQNISVFERIIERKGFVKKYNIVEQAKALNKQSAIEDEQGNIQRFYKRPTSKDEGSIKKDDLTKIKGIGAIYQERLNSVGIYNFEHLSQISEDEAQVLDIQLDLNGRISIDDWGGQAQAHLDVKK